MTAPADLDRLIARIHNSANALTQRLPTAIDNLVRNTPNGYPPRASGTAIDGTPGKAELTPTEAAANQRLGDLWAHTTDPNYRPGPATHLTDLAEYLQTALTALTLAHSTATNCGIPPQHNSPYRCHGINHQGCDDWADTNRTDRLCIDCGRTTDSNARRQRRYRATHRTDPAA